MNKLIASILVSIGITAAGVSLAADPASTLPATSGAQTRHGTRHHHEQRAFRLPSERIEARLAYLKTALKITDAQLPQWNALADTLRKQAVERDKRIQERRARMAQRSEHQKLTALDRMEQQQQRHAHALSRLNDLLAVERPLYAVLTADQKQVADEVLAPRSRLAMFHHWRMHRPQV